ncbi:MAG: hypothetical protein M0R76_00360 [Proteobacteria bacterium]|nr:hypothetical protein [Pseudomonadota bacterium]
MTAFRRDYRNAIDNFGGGLAGQQVDAYGERVEQALDDVVRRMGDLAGSQKDIHYAKGDVAEAWHAGTFNVDTARRGLDASATAPRDASPIDVSMRGSSVEHAQLKYFRSPEDTAKAISHPKYGDLDQKVVPSDQLDGVREAAARLAARNAQSRPEVADSYSHTANTADDRVRMDGAESRPLSEREARELVKELREKQDVDREQFGLTPQQVIQWQDILREATTAAARAAIISAALQSAPYLVAIARKAWETGEISAKDFAPLAQALPATLLRSGVAGGLSAAIVGTARAGVLGGALQQVDPTFVAAGVTLAISAFETSIRAARGDITWPVAAKCISEDAIVLASAMGGAAIGQALIPIPMLGALVGNIVGAVVARLAIEQVNGVILGIAAETGWTVFGLVDQNYTVPGEILDASGWNVLDIRKLGPQAIELKRMQPINLALKNIDMKVLRRGVVSFGRVAYLT